jgi:hypothetical protein
VVPSNLSPFLGTLGEWSTSKSQKAASSHYTSVIESCTARSSDGPLLLLLLCSCGFDIRTQILLVSQQSASLFVFHSVANDRMPIIVIMLSRSYCDGYGGCWCSCYFHLSDSIFHSSSYLFIVERQKMRSKPSEGFL